MFTGNNTASHGIADRSGYSDPSFPSSLTHPTHFPALNTVPDRLIPNESSTKPEKTKKTLPRKKASKANTVLSTTTQSLDSSVTPNGSKRLTRPSYKVQANQEISDEQALEASKKVIRSVKRKIAKIDDGGSPPAKKPRGRPPKKDKAVTSIFLLILYSC